MAHILRGGERSEEREGDGWCWKGNWTGLIQSTASPQRQRVGLRALLGPCPANAERVGTDSSLTIDDSSSLVQTLLRRQPSQAQAAERKRSGCRWKDANAPGGQGRGGDCIFGARVCVREQLMALRGLLEDDAGFTFFAPLHGFGCSGLLVHRLRLYCHTCSVEALPFSLGR